MADEKNPEYVFSVTDTQLLIKLLRGNALEHYARKELAKRGVNKKGVWVGFDESEKIWE